MEPMFFACWVSQGEWEIRVDVPRQPKGQRHVHIRRRKNRKGEYSWNEDGSRHDKHRFPVSEGMIGKAKEIAARKLRVPVGSLEMLTGLPRGGHVGITHNGLLWLSEAAVFAEYDSIILVSADWLIIVSPEAIEKQFEEGVTMIEEIRKAVHDAALGNQKIAMFHFQVLKNADVLEGVDPEAFCRDINVPKTYQTEFRKMISLARVMREQGVQLD
jgi:hypothetical protein